MIPEAMLVAVLIGFFIADFASANDKRRKWFNPVACIYLAVLTVVCILPLDRQILCIVENIERNPGYYGLFFKRW